MMNVKKYKVARVQGMCGGVFSALAKIDRALALSPKGVWVLHELVHNRRVTGNLCRKGVRFVETLEEIPAGSSVVIGAHGVSAATEKELRNRAAMLTDATCPLVKKLHEAAHALGAEDQLVLFGRSGHPEVDGVSGYSRAGKSFIVSSLAEISALPELSRPFFMAQTTVDHQKAAEAEETLRRKYPALRVLSGVCDASFQRQNAVIELASECDAVLVIGSSHSSNASRLRELVEAQGCRAFLIDGVSEVPWTDLDNAAKVGITSGASTPGELVDEVIAALEIRGFQAV